jgi:hypothetical protein
MRQLIKGLYQMNDVLIESTIEFPDPISDWRVLAGGRNSENFRMVPKNRIWKA